MSEPKKKAAKKATMPPAVLGLVKLVRLLAGPRRRVVLAVLLVAGFLGGWYLVWREVRPRVLASDEYQLSPDDVQTTPRPEWIRADVCAEVFRDASLDGPLSIMDADLNERIANAFSLHPWVARVGQVRKRYPARVEVELVWRRPVCMVATAEGLLPVDVEGVLLPRGDFSQVEAGRYPRLVGVNTAPIGPVGTRWGDGRVVDAAEIAAAFGPAWQQLKLDRITPAPGSAPRYSPETSYELFTRGGTRILWGRGPASKMPSKIPAADKVARLRQYAAENGSLEGPAGPQVLDARTLNPLRGQPRQAQRHPRAGA